MRVGRGQPRSRSVGHCGRRRDARLDEPDLDGEAKRGRSCCQCQASSWCCFEAAARFATHSDIVVTSSSSQAPVLTACHVDGRSDALAGPRRRSSRRGRAVQGTVGGEASSCEVAQAMSDPISVTAALRHDYLLAALTLSKVVVENPAQLMRRHRLEGAAIDWLRVVPTNLKGHRSHHDGRGRDAGWGKGGRTIRGDGRGE